MVQAALDKWQYLYSKIIRLKVIVSGSPRLKDQFLAKGVDQYIDYKTENYCEVLSDIDYVIDTLGPNEFDKRIISYETWWYYCQSY